MSPCPKCRYEETLADQRGDAVALQVCEMVEKETRRLGYCPIHQQKAAPPYSEAEELTLP